MNFFLDSVGAASDSVKKAWCPKRMHLLNPSRRDKYVKYPALLHHVPLNKTLQASQYSNFGSLDSKSWQNAWEVPEAPWYYNGCHEQWQPLAMWQGTENGWTWVIGNFPHQTSLFWLIDDHWIQSYLNSCLFDLFWASIRIYLCIYYIQGSTCVHVLYQLPAKRLLKHETQIISETKYLHNLKTFQLKTKYKYTRYQMYQAVNFNILTSSSQHTRHVPLSLGLGPNWFGIILSSITLGTKVHRR